MTPAQFDRAERLFDRAIELALSERNAFVDASCGDDPVVRRRVELMLAEHITGTSFLDEPAFGRGFHVVAGAGVVGDGLGDDIAVDGRYQNLTRIAEGGFGVVYRAQQIAPVRRPVAVKVLKPGMDSRQILGRFEAERQTLALMDHPNIATVFDAGVTANGRPFFVMELVLGLPITHYCDSARLNVVSRIELFSQVCRAVQHAHQKGVIHRDLKPSNVLVAAGDAGAPFAKVIDFGIARAVQRDASGATQLTQEGSGLGTPLYMSPEQAAGEADIDTRTDVYSLGVMLYQILSGTLPFDERTLRTATRSALSPVRPSLRVTRPDAGSGSIAVKRNTDLRRLARTLRGDLDWIALKCLEHDRATRYASADALDADLHRFLRHEPILARPPSGRDWVRKFVRRNRAAVAGATVAILAVIGGLVASLIGFSQAQKQRALADARNEELRFQLYVSQIERAQRIIETDGSESVKPLLDETEPDLRGWEWQRLHWLADRSESTARPHAQVLTLDCSPDGRHFVTGAVDGSFCLWDSRDMRALLEVGATPQAAVRAVRFSPDGSLIGFGNAGGELDIWDAASTTCLRTIATNQQTLDSVAFSPDNRYVAAASRNSPTCVYSVSTGELALVLDSRAGAAVAVSYSPDGARILAGNFHNLLFVCDAIDGSVLLEERGSDFVIWDAALSPDGAQVASVGMDAQIWVRDSFDGALRYKTPTGRQNARRIKFSPDGKLLAVGGADGIITLFDAERGTKRQSLRGHDAGINDLAFDPRSTALISSDESGILKRWDLGAGYNDVRYQHLNSLSCAAFAPRDPFVFCGGEDLGVIRIDLRVKVKDNNEVIPQVSGILPHADGRRIAAVGSGKMILLDESLQLLNIWPASGGAGISPAGDRVLFIAPDYSLVMHDAETGELLARIADDAGDPRRSVAFASDGRTVLSGHADGRVRIWDLEQGGSPGMWSAHAEGAVVRLKFDATARHLLSASSAGQIRVWTWPQRELRATLATGPVHALAISPDASRVATAGEDNNVRLWNVARGRQTMTAGRHSLRVSDLTFSADGSMLASAGADHILNVWRARATPLSAATVDGPPH